MDKFLDNCRTVYARIGQIARELLLVLRNFPSSIFLSLVEIKSKSAKLK